MNIGTSHTHRHIIVNVILVAGILAGVLYADAAGATTFFVATTYGNDANRGTTLALPFRTIKRGIAAMRTGDTLYIRGGEYYESINSQELRIPIGTSWNNAPRIAAYPGETVVLTGTYGNGINLAAAYVQYIIFDGLIIDGGGLSVQSGAHHVRFQNGEVRNSLGQGIQGGFGSPLTTDLQLINIKVHHNGNPVRQNTSSGGRLDHGIYVAIQNLLIDGCEVYENTGYGIHIYDSGGGNASNTIIRNCRVYNNYGDGGVMLASGDNIQFYDNIVYNNYNGVGVNYNATNAQVYKNSIYDHPGGTGVEIGTAARNTVVRNNSIYNNANAIVDHGPGTTVSDNILENVSTVDPESARSQRPFERR
jgi:parallel beta-helix repeat protein